MNFDEAFSKLTCPHAPSCKDTIPESVIEGCSRDNCLTLKLQCPTCNASDHLIFDVDGSLDRSDHLGVNVGDEFEIVGDLPGTRFQLGQRGRITAISDNPLYEHEKVVVGVVTNIEGGQPYDHHIINIGSFEKHRDVFEFEGE